MLEEFDTSLFDKKGCVIVVTTNGFVNPDGYAELRSETAQAAQKVWLSFPNAVADNIRKNGNCVHLVCEYSYSPFPMSIVSFPTKPGRIYLADHENLIKEAVPPGLPRPKYLPGWASKSNVNIIRHSAEELIALTDAKGWEKVYLPKVGCGSGKLQWSDVKPVLGKMLDDRFVVVHQEKKRGRPKKISNEP